MRLDHRILRPDIVFLIVWLVVIVGAYIAPRDHLYRVHGGEISVFTTWGTVWLFLAIGAFLFGTVVASRHIATFDLSLPRLEIEQLRLLLIFTVILTTTLTTYIILWTLTAASSVGGVTQFIELLTADWNFARDVWRDHKPFTGGRLLYTLLSSSAVLSAMLFGLYGSGNDSLGRIICLSCWLCSLLVVIFIGVLVSQRNLILMTFVASFGGFLFVTDKGINIYLIAAIPLLGVAVWTMQEAVLRGTHADGFGLSGIVQSMEHLLYYFANNLSTVTRGVAVEERTYGLLSLEFVWEFLMVEDTIFEQLVPAWHAEQGMYRAAGPWNALIAPYQDFGVFGLVVLFGWGYLSMGLYVLARRSLFFVPFYGMILATITLSFHQQLITSINFVFNILFIIFLLLLIMHYQFTIRTDSSTEELNLNN